MSESGFVSQIFATESVYGDPRSVVLRLKSVESKLDLLFDGIGIIGECMALNSGLEILVVGNV